MKRKKNKYSVVENIFNHPLISLKYDCIYYLSFCLIFGGLFFFFRGRLLFTPDFGQSDAFHFNLSLKYYLAQNYKQNQLPFWTDLLQGGFPLLAEGQIGAFYILNFIFLRFFSFVDGYNLLFISSLFLLTVGCYLFLRQLSVIPLIAFLLSLNFVFNGAITLRLVHLNVIQVISWVPLLFFFFWRFLISGNKKYFLIIPTIISQMIFAGHQPTVYVSLFAVVAFFGIYFFFVYFGRWLKLIKLWLLIIILIICGIVLASPQIFSTLALSNYSSRSQVLSFNRATEYAFQPRQLITFINPVALGSPKTANYSRYAFEGIYWEQTPYVGLIIFIILVIVFLLSLKDRIYQNDPLQKTLTFLSAIFLLLSFGKDSPLYILFYYPPFSLFRTPARYLLPIPFFIAIFIGLYFSRKYKKKLVVILITAVFLLISIIQLIKFAYSYHLFLPAEDVLSPPSLIRFLPSGGRYLTIGQPIIWNAKVLWKKGWNDETAANDYLFMKNFLYPNSNLIFNRSVFDINTGGFDLRRQAIINQEMVSILFSGNKLNTSLYDLADVHYIISAFKINNHSLTLISKAQQDDISVYLYKIKDVGYPFTYQPTKTKMIRYISELEQIKHARNYFFTEAFVEEQSAIFINNKGKIKINSVIKENTGELKLNIKADRKTFLALKASYFPNWQIEINGQPTKLYRVNFVNSGFWLSPGNNNIRIYYYDKNFLYGLLTSVFVFVLIMIYVLIPSRVHLPFDGLHYKILG